MRVIKMINKYRKKPIIVEAVKWTGLNLEEIKNFVDESLLYNICDGAWEVGEAPVVVDMQIRTLEGNMSVSVGDYIIKGVQGEFYPCKPDIFKETYETVSMVSDNDRTTVPMSQYIKLENKNKKLRNTINRLKRELEVED